MKPTYILLGVNDYKQEVINVPIVFAQYMAVKKEVVICITKNGKEKGVTVVNRLTLNVFLSVAVWMIKIM